MLEQLHWPKTLGKKLQIDLKLDRMTEILERLGSPEKHLPPVIHVAGTNGKGSLVSYLRYILKEAGYKVHAYISPHLIHFNERIILNGKLISDDFLFEVMERTRVAAEIAPIFSDSNVGLTLFEAITAGAFIAFSQHPADFLILEVGMGGRLDATNIVNKTIISAITPIDLDHQEYLGDTVELIAHEKAGIIKSGIPVVVAKQQKIALDVIEYHARALKAPVSRFGHEWLVKPVASKSEDIIIVDGHKRSEGVGFNFFNFSSDRVMTSKDFYPLPSLIGPHQIENAGNAIAICQILNSRYSYEICKEHIEVGLQKTRWRARMEPVGKGKLRDMLHLGWEIYLDGAHNTSGATTIARWAEQQNKPVYLVLGLTKGKDIEAFLSALKDKIKFVCSVCVYHETNAQRGFAISDVARKLGINTRPFEFLVDAMHYLASLNEKKAAVVICGSLYLAGDILKIQEGAHGLIEEIGENEIRPEDSGCLTLQAS